MKFITYCLLIFLTFGDLILCAQNSEGKARIEIVSSKLSLNVGSYRGRTLTTNRFFEQGAAGFSQLYFPFQLVIDYKSNFTDSSISNDEYNSRIFLVRPSFLFHYVNNGSYAIGGACQLSWKLISDFYFEYQLGLVYLEATIAAQPDLNSGFALHHYISLSKPISKRFSTSLGFTHISGANISDSKSSNHDLISLGLKFSIVNKSKSLQ